MPKDARVAVLIVNWNNYPDTSKCLDSLGRLVFKNYQVIVVDNGSSDGSVELIRDNYPHLTLLESEDNLGFAGGNNIGIKSALVQDFQYILLLNNDTEVIQATFLGDLIEEISKDDLIAAIGPKVLKTDGNPQITILPYPKLFQTILNTLGMVHPNMESRQLVDSITGCCVLVRSAAIQAAGLLDENYFMYGEETEWFYRMRTIGWKILYYPVKSIIHKGATSSRKIDNITIYIERRANVIYTLVKGNQKLEALFSALLMTAVLGIRVFYSNVISRTKTRLPASMIRDQLAAFRDKWKIAQDLIDTHPPL